eukprot:TRINITY_DN774220_c0_g1_i1.p1 TRINITY_DN774220_c0_g1~~TRINITY_DN774220_c0_g1_i1.p1  ORF type:complete len:238 (-),score=59.40 TRINITY_DN774220_c0_g1_i1:123-836(-)
MDSNFERKDKRSSNELRKFQIQLDVISHANGSVFFQSGNTQLMVSIQGPRNQSYRQQKESQFSESAQLNCEFRYAAFSKPGPRIDDQKAKEDSLVLQEALMPSINLEKYPKSVIDVYVLVLEAGGEPMAPAIMASSMALANANIELFDIVTATSAIGIKNEESIEILADPSQDEIESDDKVSTTFVAYMPEIGKITHMVHSGELSTELMDEAFALCMDGCRTVGKLAREHLKGSIDE